MDGRDDGGEGDVVDGVQSDDGGVEEGFEGAEGEELGGCGGEVEGLGGVGVDGEEGLAGLVHGD